MAKTRKKRAATKKAATKAKAKTQKSKRKRCAAESCRKLAKVGGDLCEKCESEAHFPIDAVMKLTPVRAMRWEVLETTIRNHGQGIQILNHEIELAKRDQVAAQTAYQAAQGARYKKKENLLAAAQAVQKEYQELTQAIADEFGLDPKQMSIDPDTCAVHDLRPSK
jgi:hypothetical protein